MLLRTRLCKEQKMANGTLRTRPEHASCSCASSLTGFHWFLPGTDEDAIIEILTKLNISQRQQVLITYKSSIGRVGGLQRLVPLSLTGRCRHFWGYVTWVKCEQHPSLDDSKVSTSFSWPSLFWSEQLFI